MFGEKLRDKISYVIAGGESGSGARLCDYEWVLGLREQCISNNVSFIFKQTGENFKKDNKIFKIKRSIHGEQAKRAGIDFLVSNF